MFLPGSISDTFQISGYTGSEGMEICPIDILDPEMMMEEAATDIKGAGTTMKMVEMVKMIMEAMIH